MRDSSEGDGQTAVVTVVVVDFNGGELTRRCLTALDRTEWDEQALEIVLVDNGSEELASTPPPRRRPVRVISMGRNAGFPAAVNAGVRSASDSAYVAVVNNDAFVEPGWLRPLVEEIERDERVGVATAKVLLADRYLAVDIESETTRAGPLDRRRLGVRVSRVLVDGEDVSDRVRLVSGFYDDEPTVGHGGVGVWTRSRAAMLIPVRGDHGRRMCIIELSSRTARAVTVRSGGESTACTVDGTARTVAVCLVGEPFDVINNAGSELLRDGFGRDRGLYETDRGQYDVGAEIGVWSGTVALLSKRYLDDLGPFDERLFAYYEDLDLAWRGHRRGWRYRYVPAAVARHVHGATSRIRSPRFMYLNERNRLVVTARNAPLGTAGRVVLGSLRVTIAYVVRDVINPVLQGEPPRVAVAAVRLRALMAFLRLLPGTLHRRWRDCRLPLPDWTAGPGVSPSSPAEASRGSKAGELKTGRTRWPW